LLPQHSHNSAPRPDGNWPAPSLLAELVPRRYSLGQAAFGQFQYGAGALDRREANPSDHERWISVGRLITLANPVVASAGRALQRIPGHCWAGCRFLFRIHMCGAVLGNRRSGPLSQAYRGDLCNLSDHSSIYPVFSQLSDRWVSASSQQPVDGRVNSRVNSPQPAPDRPWPLPSSCLATTSQTCLGKSRIHTRENRPLICTLA